MPLYRATCYFCGHAWGECTCSFPEAVDETGKDTGAPGFDFGGCWITSPNVSECSRFFVDPVEYYGEAFLTSALAATLRRKEGVT